MYAEWDWWENLYEGGEPWFLTLKRNRIIGLKIMTIFIQKIYILHPHYVAVTPWGTRDGSVNKTKLMDKRKKDSCWITHVYQVTVRYFVYNH